MVILNLMATCFGPRDQNLAILQERNLGPCSADL